ncbi:MAG: UbiX family flavin prenyltransferase [Planctomycetes bacterium]|nr:UbiX family flavin prenyltransferase [Planctomycetota bacterium]
MMKEEHPPRRVVLAVSGASGAIYAVRCLQMLVSAKVHVDLVYSGAAKRVLFEECNICFEEGDDIIALLGDPLAQQFVTVHKHGDIGATIASGSALGEAVIVLPCSLSTLAGISNGSAANLIERSAQVALKEQRKLIIVPRETPLSRTHLDHMSRLAWAGATIMPASPGFYHCPQSIEELVDHLCAKILGVCGIKQTSVAPWTGCVLDE